MKRRIYLDNNATTLVDGPVKDVILQLLEKPLGNPSSIHSFGKEARAILSQARNTIANHLKIKPEEIIFTSGGTESLNMVLRGVFGSNPLGHLITSSVEHAAVFSTAQHLQKIGTNVTYLNPGLWGAVTPDAVKNAIRSDTRLIALMAVNNETGVKTDVAAIASIAKEASIPFLVDGIALLGKEPFEIPEGVTAMAFSGHKIHAPSGIGIAWVHPSMKLSPLISGGDQEFGKRGGTENLPGVAAFAKAIELLDQELPEASLRMARLRDKFENALKQEVTGIFVNGEGPRISNTSNLAFEGVEGETLLMMLDIEGVAASHGSACASGALEPSRVLREMGISKERAASSVRFSLSRMTTEQEIDEAVKLILFAIDKLRA